MNLDLILLDEAGLNEELGDVLALIALELDYLAQLLVLHHIPIATEVLLQVLEDLVVAEIFLQPLNCSQTLLPIPLLDPYMHVLLVPRCIRVLRVRKRIESCWNLHV